MAQISVIVPVYKVEAYLRCCVSSILNQTYSDFELILVDDGSPDGCPRLCDEYAARDPRVRVIHKMNGGLSSARNAGLDAMTGEFVAFIDGDDAVHPQYLEFLLGLLTGQDADCAMCHYDFFSEEGAWFCDPVAPENASISLMEGPALLAEFHKHCRRVSLVSQCMKLYKKEVFEGLRMEEGRIQEDSLFLPYLLKRAQKIVRAKLPLYHWRITPGSISRSPFGPRDFDRIHLSRRWVEFFESQKDAFHICHFQREYLRQVLKYYYKTTDEAPELMPALKPYLKLYRRLFSRYIRANGLCSREKVAYALFLVCPAAARGLYESVYGQEDAP